MLIKKMEDYIKYNDKNSLVSDIKNNNLIKIDLNNIL